MWNYVGFGLAAFMLMVSLTVGSWWAIGWLFLVWRNALGAAASVQLQETIARIPPDLKAEFYKALTNAKGVRP